MRLVLVAVFLTLLTTGVASAKPPDLPKGIDAKAAALLSAYYDAYSENDYDRMASFYDDDAVFEDPTSDVFLRGKAKLRETMNALDAYRQLHWRVHQVVRDGDVIAGQASITGEANGTPFATRFATIITLKDGKIVRHIDYVDNRPPFAALGGASSDKLWDGRALDDVAGIAGAKPSSRREALGVAKDYLGALDHVAPETVENLYAEGAIFEDPTFRLFFRGRAAIAAYAREAFAAYHYVRFTPETLIADADGAVIEGTAFGVSNGFQAPLRFMTFLRVEDGKIASHADFFDYGEHARLRRARDLTRDGGKSTPACEARATKQFAFWPGSWVAKIASGTEVGRNRIERAAGGCAIVEHWNGILATDMKKHFARGLHWFDDSADAWRHVWVDDGGGALEFKGATDGEAVVYVPVREADPKKRTRMTIRPLADGRVEQYGEESSDRAKTWRETFRIYYSRAEQP